MIIDKVDNDWLDKLLESFGIDPLYGITFLVIISFFIVWGKRLYLISKKDVSGIEKHLKGYLISQIVAMFILLVCSVLHFLKFF